MLWDDASHVTLADQPQVFESMPGYTVEKRAADNMLKSSVREPQRLAPKSNCELAPGRGLEP